MMLLFSSFGYIGFVYAYLFFRENILVDIKVFKRYDLLTLLLFLPNMHFWTASLGKGSLIFMGLMLFVVAIKRPRQRILILLLGGFIVYMIRPSVMLFVLGGVMVGLLTGREKLGIGTAVISMPCWEIFNQQDAVYRESVLGHGIRIGIEAAVRQGWDAYLGDQGGFVGMTGFGASGPAEELYRLFNITPEAVIALAKDLIVQN